MLSNDVYIYFTLKKKIGKIVNLKKHAETLRSIVNLVLNASLKFNF